jgi:ABC-2 type transport system ATP-binding protein
MLELKKLSKRLGSHWALDECSLAVSRGERLVIGGANGAGKSTLLQVLAKVLTPDRGQLLLDGEPLYGPGRPHSVGYVPEAADPPGHLTVAELLHFVAAVKGCSAATMESLEPLDLQELMGQRIAELSLGQRRRACLAAAFTGDPEILLLDEPTNGLDPASIMALGTLLASPASDRILICATHDLDFAKSIETRHLTMASGKIAPD